MDHSALAGRQSNWAWVSSATSRSTRTREARSSFQNASISGGSAMADPPPSHDLVLAGEHFTEAGERRRRERPVDLVDPDVDLAIGQREEAPAVGVALHEKRSEEHTSELQSRPH